MNVPSQESFDELKIEVEQLRDLVKNLITHLNLVIKYRISYEDLENTCDTDYLFDNKYNAEKEARSLRAYSDYGTNYFVKEEIHVQEND